MATGRRTASSRIFDQEREAKPSSGSGSRAFHALARREASAICGQQGPPSRRCEGGARRAACRLLFKPCDRPCGATLGARSDQAFVLGPSNEDTRDPPLGERGEVGPPTPRSFVPAPRDRLQIRRRSIAQDVSIPDVSDAVDAGPSARLGMEAALRRTRCLAPRESKRASGPLVFSGAKDRAERRSATFRPAARCPPYDPDRAPGEKRFGRLTLSAD